MLAILKESWPGKYVVQQWHKVTNFRVEGDLSLVKFSSGTFQNNCQLEDKSFEIEKNGKETKLVFSWRSILDLSKVLVSLCRSNISDKDKKIVHRTFVYNTVTAAAF